MFNHLTALESGAFAGLTNLELLDLTGNALQSIESGDFAGLQGLQMLFLRDTDLAAIEAGDFTGLSALSRLEIGKLRWLPLRQTASPNWRA